MCVPQPCPRYPRYKIDKPNCHYFSILSKSYFMHFLPRSHIFRSMAVVGCLSGLGVHNWPNWVVQRTVQGGLAAHVTKIRKCWGCEQKHFFEKLNPEAKTNNTRLLLVQYHFAAHHPLKPELSWGWKIQDIKSNTILNKDKGYHAAT